MASQRSPVMASAASTVAANISQLLKPGVMTREDASAATRFRCVPWSSFFHNSLGARSSACARKPQSTSGCEPSWKLRKSGDCGSVAERIASRASPAYRCCDSRSAPASSGASSHGAMPASNRPMASRCVYLARSAGLPVTHSTGMFRFSVPAARFFSTGSAIFASVCAQYWRSVSWAPCGAPRPAAAENPSPATL
jgi:hypothetical protein